VIYREVGQPDPTFWTRVSALTAPTLLLGGGPTSHIEQEWLDEFAAELADVRSVRIDAGHHIHTNAPAEFAETVLPFLTPG
jgi:3-oxoadipate enol-lactonase